MAQVINPQVSQQDDALNTGLKGLQVADSIYGIMAKRASIASSTSGSSTPSAASSNNDADAMGRRLYSTQQGGG